MQKSNKFQQFFTRLHQSAKPVGQATTFLATAGTLATNSLLIGLPVWTAGLVKTLTGSQLADKAILGLANHWIHTNNTMIDKVLPQIDLRVNLPDDLSVNGKYLLVCNHQSWVDTTLVQYISENRLPLTRFFTKYELIYLPVIGQGFYFLDFPMMKRYSKEAIAKNPALKNRDFDEAKRACDLLSHKPFTLLNFVEGTRFTPKKHELQKSPYENLLKPKAGGVALALGALGDKIDSVLDMTIVYPDGIPSYQDLWQGNIRRIGIDVRHVKVPDDLMAELLAGKFQTEKTTKTKMYAWLDKIWQEKQQIMQQLLADFN